MPRIRDISLSLKTGEVLRREGLGGGAKVRRETKDLILELLASVRRMQLLQSAAAYECYPVTGVNGDRISLEGGGAIHGPLIPAMFPGAKELAVLICTIGPWLEKQVTEYSRSGKVMKAMILDGIGSAAVDILISQVVGYMATDISPRGYEMSSQVCPGMPGFPLSEQWNLLRLVDADEIGVSVTASGVMVPRKSTSMVIGIGPRMARWTQAEVCARCSLRETCHYKVTE
ncbi:MAG: hypothetical protein R6V59_08250 [Dehalococcoidia bacterium]